jgi:predicted transcriptional regulator
MERLCSVYFELSNEERVEILKILERSPQNFTYICEKLSLNSQQCSRHLTRLLEAELIEKKPDGAYHISNYGRILLKLGQSIDFTSARRDYFLTHDLSKIPYEFVTRLGDLSNSSFTQDVMSSISEFESIINEAEEFLWVIINKRTRSVRPFIARAIERGINLKSISPTSYIPQIDVKRAISESDELIIIRAEGDGRVEVADTEQFDVYLWVSEKASFLSFPLNDGTFDYTGFISSDQRAVQFCRDLFNYYWKRVRIIPRVELVERHLQYVNYYGVYPKYP